MDHYSHITRAFDGVECRLVATTDDVGFVDGISRILEGDDMYEHVHIYINPKPTNEIREYMIFVGGKRYENNRTHTVFGREVHGRTRQHL